MDLDAATLEPASRVAAEPARDLREDLGRGVHENPALGNALELRVGAQRCLRHVVELGERLDARVAGADEDEAELRRVLWIDRRALELQEDVVAEPDCVGEVLEADAVLGQAGYRQGAGRRAERDHETLVADLEGSGKRVDGDGLPVTVVSRDLAEDELRMRTHLPKRDDDVPWLERSRCRFRKERRVEHEVLGRDDGGAASLQQARDVAPGETASEHERPTACLVSLHGSCLPRWRPRSQSSGAGASGKRPPKRSADCSQSAGARSSRVAWARSWRPPIAVRSTPAERRLRSFRARAGRQRTRGPTMWSSRVSATLGTSRSRAPGTP